MSEAETPCLIEALIQTSPEDRDAGAMVDFEFGTIYECRHVVAGAICRLLKAVPPSSQSNHEPCLQGKRSTLPVGAAVDTYIFGKLLD